MKKILKKIIISNKLIREVFTVLFFCITKIKLMINLFERIKNYWQIKSIYQKRFTNKYIGLISSEAIGPFVMLAELYMRKFKTYNIDPKKDVVLVLKEQTANDYFLKLLRSAMKIIQDDELYAQIYFGGYRYLNKINKYIFDDYNNGLVYYPDCKINFVL